MNLEIITMTSASMTFGRPTRIAMPRGAQWFASLTNTAIQSLRSLDQWLIGFSRQDPQSPEEVLAWANRIERTEPGFAADLRSAALRAMGKNDL